MTGLAILATLCSGLSLSCALAMFVATIEGEYRTATDLFLATLVGLVAAAFLWGQAL